MLNERIRVEERQAHGERCAYCHGALDGEPVRCELCGAECHADCAAQLGRCPTLGCARAVPRPRLSSPTVGPGALGTAAAAASDARRPSLAAIPDLPVFAAIGGIGGLLSLGIATVLSLGHGVDAIVSFWALFVTMGLIALMIGGARALRLLTALPRLPWILRDEPATGTLRVHVRAERQRSGHHAGSPELHVTAQVTGLAPRGGEPLLLAIDQFQDQPWLLHTQEIPVGVRGSRGSGPYLLESRAGHVALVLGRRAPPPVAPPAGGVEARVRRGWRS